MIIHCLDLGGTTDNMIITRFFVDSKGVIHHIDSDKWYKRDEISDDNRKKYT